MALVASLLVIVGAAGRADAVPPGPNGQVFFLGSSPVDPGTVHVFSSNSDGEALRQSSGAISAGPSFLSVSPDGTKVLGVDPGGVGMFTIDSDGSNLLPFPDPAGAYIADVDGHWLNDTQIVVDRSISISTRQIVLTDAAGVLIDTLTTGIGRRAQGDLSQDGTTVAYVQSNNLFASTRGLHPRATQLTDSNLTGGAPRSPRFSPAGDWIAYEDSGSLWIVTPAGTDGHQISGVSLSSANDFAWSPDGLQLLYAAPGLPRAWFTVGLDGSAPVPFVLPALANRLARPMWSSALDHEGDVTGPPITLRTPTESGDSFTTGDTVTWDFSCGPVLNSCVGFLSGAAPVFESGTSTQLLEGAPAVFGGGTSVLSVLAADHLGNLAQRDATFSVVDPVPYDDLTTVIPAPAGTPRHTNQQVYAGDPIGTTFSAAYDAPQPLTFHETMASVTVPAGYTPLPGTVSVAAAPAPPGTSLFTQVTVWEGAWPAATADDVTVFLDGQPVPPCLQYSQFLAPVPDPCIGVRATYPGTGNAFTVASSTTGSTIGFGLATAPTSGQSATVSPGGTVSTNTAVTAADPVGTAVTSPNGGAVTISESSTAGPVPGAYSLLGGSVEISAPSASPEVPLALTFLLDASILPADPYSVVVFRDGVLLQPCTGAPGIASPDPCIAQRNVSFNGDLILLAYTSHASRWNFGVPGVVATPPSVSASASQQPALTGWFTTATSVTVTGTPGSSPISSVTYALGANPSTTVAGSAATVALPEGTTVVSFSTTDTAGLTASGTATFKVDTGAPQLPCSSTPTGWSAVNITVTCTATDAVSGLALPADAAFNLTTAVPALTETATAATGSRTVCDIAGNCATAGPITGLKVDRAPPAVTVSTPTANATYLLGQHLNAAYGCSDGGSGLSSCIGPVAIGGVLDTAVLGAHTFAVTGTDAVGNTATRSVAYTVVKPPDVLSVSLAGGLTYNNLSRPLLSGNIAINPLTTAIVQTVSISATIRSATDAARTASVTLDVTRSRIGIYTGSIRITDVAAGVAIVTPVLPQVVTRVSATTVTGTTVWATTVAGRPRIYAVTWTATDNR